MSQRLNNLRSLRHYRIQRTVFMVGLRNWIKHIFVHLLKVIHMGVSRCFPWLSRVSNGKKPDGFGTLPDDVVVDVLGRLEVDQLGHPKRVCRRWRALIGTACFTRVHLQRASSVTVMFSLFFSRWRYNTVSLFFLDWVSVRKKPIGGAKLPALRRIAILDRSCCLLGCCDRLLIFIMTHTTSMYEICNPVTREQIALQQEDSICGFFLHLLSNKYWLLSYRETPNGFLYLVGSLGPAAWKDVGMFPYIPREREALSGVKGRIHWMVVGKEGMSPPCSPSIMVFSTGESKLRFMPHPGDSCLRSEGHSYMHLVEMKGRVHVYAIRTKLMSIWVLEDYASWQWVKKCDFNLEWDIKRHPVRDEYITSYSSYSNYKNMQLIDIQDRELLLFWPGRGFFRHNLQSATIKKVEWNLSKYGLDSNTSRMMIGTVVAEFKRSLVSLKDLQSS